MEARVSSGAQPAVTAAPEAAAPRLRELDLFSFALLLIRHIPFILGCALLAFAGEAIHMSRVKARYQSTAVMIVPQGNVTSQALSSQFSFSTIDLLGGGYELYADIINSHQVEDRLIEDYDLKKVYGTTNLADCEAILASLTSVLTQRDGVIRVTVQDASPNRAADLANGYLRQVDRLNSALVHSSIGEEAAFLQTEMIKEKNALEDAEVALKQLEVSYVGLLPNVQQNAGVNALEGARAQLRADQIQLAAYQTYETSHNPDVIRLNSEIARLEGQIESLQRGTNSDMNGTPTQQVPEKALQYTRQQREVIFHQSLFDALQKEYVTAQQQEAKNPSIVQVLDPARPATHKAWPPRTYYTVVATLMGLAVGVGAGGAACVCDVVPAHAAEHGTPAAAQDSVPQGSSAQGISRQRAAPDCLRKGQP